VNCYRIHQKSLNFIYPFKFYSNFTNKNVSWLHFSWPTQYTHSYWSYDLFCVTGLLNYSRTLLWKILLNVYIIALSLSGSATVPFKMKWYIWLKIHRDHFWSQWWQSCYWSTKTKDTAKI